MKITEISHIFAKDQIIFIIKRTTNQSFDGECEVNKEFKEFEFQPIINKYISESEDG